MELARRLRKSNEDRAEYGEPLAEICAEIEADRAALEQTMDSLGVSRDPIKPRLAWVVEKLGRLKLNGQLRGYSPLSRLVELEGLCIGITGKMQMWDVLAHTRGAGVPGLDFEQLAERAARQRVRVQELHRLAATETL